MNKKYELYVYCRRGGVSQDAGKHAECEADSAKEAKYKLYPEVMQLQKFYDQVSWEIHCEGKKVI